MSSTEYWQSIISNLTNKIYRMTPNTLYGCDPEPMEKLGIIIPDEPMMDLYCNKCSTYNEVLIVKGRKDKDYFYKSCPTCGRFKRISPKILRRWRTRKEPILEFFIQAVGIKGTMSEVIPERVWKLGRRGQQQFLYVNHVSDDDLKAVSNELKRYPQAIFVVPQPYIMEYLDIVLENRGIILSEVSDLTEDQRIIFDLEKIEAAIGPREIPKRTAPTRRGGRTTKIEKLVEELTEHYKASKDHYYNNGKLLPRPTQAQLAVRIGCRQNDVSRCLNDPSAHLLKMLWEGADEEKVVLDFRFT